MLFRSGRSPSKWPLCQESDPVYKGNQIKNLNKLTLFIRETGPKTVQVTRLLKDKNNMTPKIRQDLASRQKDHHHEKHK